LTIALEPVKIENKNRKVLAIKSIITTSCSQDTLIKDK
jgi:hypothetical protein